MDTVEEGGLSAHEVVARRLRERRATTQVDVSKQEAFEHLGSGETFLVAPLSYPLHAKWMGLKRFEDLQHTQAQRAPGDAVERTKSDRFLLTHAVLTEDGQPLGDEMAGILLELPGCGPDNYRLLARAEKVNPPRDELAREVTELMRAATVNIIVWQTLFEAGLGKALLDFMSTHATEEERLHAEREIQKAEECVEAMGAFFESRQWARQMGFEMTGEGLSREALDAAVEAARAVA